MKPAERAESAGALLTDSLRQLYTSIVFTKEELANPLSKAEAESGPLSRALLYRTALVQTVPLAKAEAVAKAISLARQGGRYLSAVRVFEPILKTIAPSNELLWFAPEAIRAFLILKDEDAARVWFSAVRASALFSKAAQGMLANLMPLARLIQIESGTGLEFAGSFVLVERAAETRRCPRKGRFIIYSIRVIRRSRAKKYLGAFA